MKMKSAPLILMAGLLLLLAACAGQNAPPQNLATDGEKISVAGGSYTDVSVDGLQSMFTEKNFLLVNVHIPFEGDLPETDLSIRFDEIAQNLAQLPADKDAQIVLYCRSGNMSTQAARELVELGYTNVWNLAGGFNAWKAAGLPMADE
jgi:rhodanese-related sulfurtransferase